MARVVVTSCAYLGDVAPYIPIADRLVQRGHDVAFLAPAGFAPVLAGERFSHIIYPLDFSSTAMHADPRHERLMGHPWRNAGRLGRYWMHRGFAADPEAARASVLDALDRADVVVTHPTFASVVGAAAEHCGVPMVCGQLFPMMVPTARWTPPLGSRSPDLGRPINRAAWRVLREGTRLAFYDRQLNQMRRSLGLAPLRGVALVAWMAAARTVMLVSPHYYGPGAADWPPVTWGGFSVWRGPPEPVDESVLEFLEEGPAPVLVTLGTSAASGAGGQFAAIAAELDAIGRRSLLLVGDRANLASVRGRPGAFVFAPVTQVLPRCRVAVVSGALGALAAALAAGVPVVVVPQLFDQVWHGRRVEVLGVGVMARRPRDVAAAVARIEADPGYRERSAALAAAMAGEDGPGVVADAVESVLA
jgi:UDP:flavonoid glycosyltransferase YjiC (YdhE family)